jgi:hypothetical protein
LAFPIAISAISAEASESTKIDQASKAAIEKADYYAKVAKTATENADKDAQLYLNSHHKCNIQLVGQRVY